MLHSFPSDTDERSGGAGGAGAGTACSCRCCTGRFWPPFCLRDLRNPSICSRWSWFCCWRKCIWGFALSESSPMGFAAANAELMCCCNGMDAISLTPDRECSPWGWRGALGPFEADDPCTGLLLPLRFLLFFGAIERHHVFCPRTNLGWRYEPGVCPSFPEEDSLVNP